jgi:hypothetical protein
MENYPQEINFGGKFEKSSAGESNKLCLQDEFGIISFKEFEEVERM